jgi:hypothetical protein
MSEEQLDPQLTALEQLLGRLQPAAQLDRDRVMYQAGKAEPRLRWLWPASSAVSALAAAVLGILLWRQSLVPPVPEPAPRVIVVEKLLPAAAPEPPPPRNTALTDPPADGGAFDYFRMRQEVFRMGTDALRVGPGGAAPSAETLTPGDAPRLTHPAPDWPNLLNLIPVLSGGDS